MGVDKREVRTRELRRLLGRERLAKHSSERSVRSLGQRHQRTRLMRERKNRSEFRIKFQQIVEAKTPAEAEMSGGEDIWCAEGWEAQTEWRQCVDASSQGRMRDCETRSRDRDRECRIRTVNAEFNWNGNARLGSDAAGLKEKNVGW